MTEDANTDDLFFAEEESPESADDNQGETRWKILIVDDEEEVHRVTKMVLSELSFDGHGLVFFDAYSGEEARQFLQEHEDTALVLLDVVMETDDAGLQTAEYIRQQLHNPFVRIILRTGQPGMAPEEKVILEYDINDYKSKTELTSRRLFTTIITALRSFRDIMTIEHNKRGLRKVIDASPTIFRMQSLDHFTGGVLEQLTSLLNLDRGSIYCHGFAAEHACDRMIVKAATGQFEVYLNQNIMESAEPDTVALLKKALSEKQNILSGSDYVGYLPGKHGEEFLIYIHGWGELEPWDRDLINIFFTNVSVAHDNLLLNLEIEETQSEVIYTLGEIAEARSRETGRHVKRVAEYSRLLGKLIGLNDQEAEVLRLASPMHDVGKLGIPDAILNKPGRLTPSEWEVMKTHAGLGRDMLKHSDRPLMKAACIVAGQHHEKWDGSGYPAGLKGTDIHLYGRITAIADVFDALSVTRVYKDAWPLEKVLDFFNEQKGRHFDPSLVDILIANIDRFTAILRNNTHDWERGEAPRPL